MKGLIHTTFSISYSIQLILFTDPKCMHARQPFFNICNTAVLGYHGDNLIYSNSVNNNIKYVKNQIIKYVKITDKVKYELLLIKREQTLPDNWHIPCQRTALSRQVQRPNLVVANSVSSNPERYFSERHKCYLMNYKPEIGEL